MIRNTRRRQIGAAARKVIVGIGVAIDQTALLPSNRCQACPASLPRKTKAPM
jgi:hypothetical protein